MKYSHQPKVAKGNVDKEQKDEGKEKRKSGELSGLEVSIRKGCLKLKFQKWCKGIRGNYMGAIIF